jgi:hypothetical protein
VRSETVQVDDKFGKEYAGTYVFMEISWGKRNRIVEKYVKYNRQTGEVIATDNTSIQAETVWASLKQQPEGKPVTLEKLLSEDESGVPIGLGELFSKVVNRLNGVSGQETKNS